MRSILSVIVVLVALFSTIEAKELVIVAMVYDGAEVEDFAYFELIKREIIDILSDDFTVGFKNYNGNWDDESIKRALNEAVNDPEVSAVVVTGLMGSKLSTELEELKKPMAIPYVLSQEVQDLMGIKEGPIPQNLLIFRGEKSLKKDLQVLYKITPFQSLAIVGDASILSEEFGYLRDGFKKAAKEAHFEVDFITVKDDPYAVINALNKKRADAVFLFPTWRLSDKDFKFMIREVSEMNIPTTSYLGEPDLYKGVLLTTTPSTHLKRAARRIALNLQELFLHKDDADADVMLEFPSEWDLIVNKTVADKLNLDLSWEIYGLARFIELPVEVEPVKMVMADAMREAIESNLQMLAEKYRVEASYFEMQKVRSHLMPQVFGKAAGRIIDRDRAKASFGENPQYGSLTGVEFSQNVYNDQLSADLDVSRRGYCSSIFNQKSVALDIETEASLAFLNVLRSKAQVAIEYDNLMLTKANLRRAHERVKSGEAGKSEVYRWENEIATNQKKFLDAKAQLENLQTAFNRVLNRPLDRQVLLEDSEEKEYFFLSLEDFAHCFDTKDHTDRFRHYFTHYALQKSPELKAIDQQICACERIVQAARRASYIPKVAAVGDVARIYKGGAGTRPPAGFHVDDTNWRIGFEAVLPLYTSGGLRAEERKACALLRGKTAEKAILKESIEESVSSSVDILRARYQAITLARQAAVAAEENLKIVTDSYTRGVVSIIDLIDAQNAMFVSKLASSDAIYDFVIELMQFQRRIGEIYINLNSTESSQLEQSFKSYMGSVNG